MKDQHAEEGVLPDGMANWIQKVSPRLVAWTMGSRVTS